MEGTSVARYEERRACESPESFAKLPTPIAFALGVPPAALLLLTMHKVRRLL